MSHNSISNLLVDEELVQSPCTNVCRLNQDNICIGCERTIQEIIDWPTKSISQKHAILNRLKNIQAADSV